MSNDAIYARDNMLNYVPSRALSLDEFVELKKKMAEITKSGKRLEVEKCLYCGGYFTDSKKLLCASHSIPRHSLKKLSENGKILNFNSLIQHPLVDQSQGSANAGTFRLICRECDSLIFREYENFNNYESGMKDNEFSSINQKILNQIAMKNHLKTLYNEMTAENDLRNILSYFGDVAGGALLENRLAVTEQNRRDAMNYFESAKRLSKKYIRDYAIAFFEMVPRRMPIVAQCAITPRYSFAGVHLNDVHDMNARMEHLHIAIFPTGDKTIVIVFHKLRAKKIRPLVKEIREFNLNDALRAIIALTLDGSDNFFISESVKDEYNDYMRILAGDEGVVQAFYSGDFDVDDFSLDQRQIDELEQSPLISRYRDIPDVFIGIDD